MNWEIKIILKTLMTKISHISWGVKTKAFTVIQILTFFYDVWIMIVLIKLRSNINMTSLERTEQSEWCKVQLTRQHFNYWTTSTWEKYQKGGISILLTNVIKPW